MSLGHTSTLINKKEEFNIGIKKNENWPFKI